MRWDCFLSTFQLAIGANNKMSRSGSVRRWLEDLRYETESYDPQMQLQQPSDVGAISWRYARVTWSPDSPVSPNQSTADNQDNTVHSIFAKEAIPVKVDTITSKVRDVVAKKEEEIHLLQSEQSEIRSHHPIINITSGTVNARRQNLSPIKPQSPDLLLRRKQTLPGVSVAPRPLSHQQPKPLLNLRRENTQLTLLPSIIKEGPINKVKLMTSGSNKSPKHWKTGMYAVLTDRAIFFAEDGNALQLMKSGAISGEVLARDRVDLREGAKIFQDVDKLYSSKKNVIGICSKDGHVAVLMQNDEQNISDAWFKDISTVIAKHADKENATQSSPGASNTKSKLNWFFKKRPNKETLVNQGIYKNEPIFGNTLERLYEASDKKRLVPAFVKRCTEILENPPHVFSVGLYRTSGNLSHIQKLRLRVDQEDADALEDATLASDSDVLAGALKLFFRELQLPLIPYNIYTYLSKACTCPNLEEKCQLTKEALRKLSPTHFQTLFVLCSHLLRITKHEQQNQMSAANLAIVWGPSFTWPDEGTGTRALYLCSDVNRVVQYLIETCETLFK